MGVASPPLYKPLLTKRDNTKEKTKKIPIALGALKNVPSLHGDES